MRMNKCLKKLGINRKFCTGLNNIAMLEQERIVKLTHIEKVKKEIYMSEIVSIVNFNLILLSIYGGVKYGIPEGLLLCGLNLYYFKKHFNIATHGCHEIDLTNISIQLSHK